MPASKQKKNANRLLDEKLSLKEIGLLATIINCPELKYFTLNDICAASPADNKKTIHKTLNDLQRKGNIIHLQDNRFTINKEKISSTNLVCWFVICF